jgi:elongation factor Ts
MNEATMEITAAMVRELREKSGAGMMDCKRALSETGGNPEEAYDFLRKQGLKSADKKASREMGEGRVHAVTNGERGAMVAVTCETDFGAGTPAFQKFLAELIEHVQANGSATAEELAEQKWKKTGDTVALAIKGVVAELGENVSVANTVTYTGGYVGAYVHHNNKVGVLVSVSGGTGDAESAVKDLCLHIAAMRPEVLHREEIPADAIEREKDIYRAEVENKPANIQDKILAGKLEKFYADRVLPEQPWVKDDKTTVLKALQATLGKEVKIQAFSRFEIGG